MQHSSLDLELQNLSKSKLKDYLRQLEGIDADMLGEPWGQAQWLMDLPSKWELSWVLLREARPIGFLIASRKESALHIHRFAVAVNERSKGLGGALMASAVRRALERGCVNITLKVHYANAGAIAFYTRLGFAAAGRQQDSLEMMGDSRRIFDLTQNFRLQTARQHVK
ncbi:MAG: GNAT family N-acetyltransferase [Pyrinomonadaceae bacterium]|jgi:ribosomal protein S18 acetylase RimI-like enzyme|nr:GNAT family N-acetyltransferase [Pyrinomonadaceae bacterium]